MRKSRFTEAQIVGMIKEQEAGMPTAEVCRKHGLSQGRFYKFKSRYGGMEVSDAAKLRALEREGYHRRSRVETKMHCLKLMGQALMARDFDRQGAEIQIRIAVLNRYTALGIPVTETVA